MRTRDGGQGGRYLFLLRHVIMSGMAALQVWFEMPDIRRRKLATSVWIPLRACERVRRQGRFGYLGFVEEFYGVGSVAVPLDRKADAEKWDWQRIGFSHSHSGYVDGDTYVPVDVYARDDVSGLNLVLEQRGNSLEQEQWHLHQDFVITLGLKREGDVWLAIDHNYLEVARLARRDSGSPSRLEVRASYLRDYMCARRLSLRVASYRQRTETVETTDHIMWPDGSAEERDEIDRWAGRVMAIHEGGEPYGEELAVFHTARTDVHVDEDVPVLGTFPEGEFASSSWTAGRTGRKLYRIDGELWRNEWLDPGATSPIVRGDGEPATVYFVVDAEGNKQSRDTLVESGRWLWFKPTVILALIERRGGSLEWYTKDTGGVACSPGHGVHFGINSLGLVNVYAKDVAQLPDWQQAIWAGHNVGPDGKLSEELHASQVKANPARTQAPEPLVRRGLTKLEELGVSKLGLTHLIRAHRDSADLMARAHRFRATDQNGLFALAKDLARLTADSFDASQLQRVVAPPKNEKWSSLKSLEKTLATKVGDEKARELMGPLFGIYELRLADAHLAAEDVESSIRLAGVDERSPFVTQGYQLLHSFVGTIYRVCKVIEEQF